MGGDPEGSRSVPLRRKPVGGRSVKNLDGTLRKTAPRMVPNPIPPQASASDYAVTSSRDPGGPQAWAPHPRWGAPLPAGHNTQGQTGTGSQGTYMAALGPTEESQQEAPRHLEICPQLKAHLQVRCLGNGQKEVSGWRAQALI